CDVTCTTEMHTRSLHDALPILGDERGTDRRPFQFGDDLDQIALTDSLRNAHASRGFTGDYLLTEDDLEVVETELRTQTSTVLMRSEEHTSELQSREKLVCRLLL